MKLSEIFASLPIDQLIKKGILKECDKSSVVKPDKTSLGAFVNTNNGPVYKRVFIKGK